MYTYSHYWSKCVLDKCCKKTVHPPHLDKAPPLLWCHEGHCRCTGNKNYLNN